MTVSQTLRVVIQRALEQGTTRYQIAKATGVDHTALSKFVRGERDCRLSTVDLLTEYLGLELRPKKRETSSE